MKKFCLLFIISLALITGGCGSNKTILPGKYDNYTLLSNGWKISPQGEHISIGDLPLNLIVDKDERFAYSLCSGMGDNAVSVIDLESFKEIQRFKLPKTFRGIVLDNYSNELIVSGGNDNLIYILKIKQGLVSLSDSILIGKPKDKISITGIDYSHNKNLIAVVSKESNSLYLINRISKNINKTINLNKKCYDVKISETNNEVYVSLWDGGAIARISLDDYKISTIKTGDHPNEILLDKTNKYLFTPNANNNTTSIIDLSANKEVERLNSALSTELPFGSTPNAICLNKEGDLLFICNADNNYIAVFNIEEIGESRCIGFIPTGWYPTSVKFLEKSNKLLLTCGKGLNSLPNPDGPNPYKKADSRSPKYTGLLFKGTVTSLNNPDKQKLKEYTKIVKDNSPFEKEQKTFSQNVVPSKHGIPSDKIKHVFYIIKENRTYDQVFGDIAKGNGDSSICLFGYNITPNEHKMTDKFALFDNFYCDAEVSADGHNWSTAAYATDYTEKNWPVSYSRRGGTYDYEGGVPNAAPSSKYIWDNVIEHGLTYRNYGEFVKLENDKYVGIDDDIKPFTSPTYPGFDLKISDLLRYEKWESEFSYYESTNSLPNLSLLRLPNDHTAGTRPDQLAPEAFVAQNDLALGKIIERITRSKFWKESVIFVLEDDAQSGSDHVDAHRSTLLVISPYIKKGFVDHSFYTTSSVLKTIELVLGLHPMTQFDLSANPIQAPFNDLGDFSPYVAESARIDLNKLNPTNGYGWKRSMEMDFSKEDDIPDVELNEIIWKSIKGELSVMPAPIQSGWLKR